MLGEYSKPISDIAWAPTMGRSYHLIATACRENTFRIHTLKREDDGTQGRIDFSSLKTVEINNKADVWRITWNATGTVLATSSQDGSISLWRKNFAGSWDKVQDISTGSKMSYFHMNPSF